MRRALSLPVPLQNGMDTRAISCGMSSGTVLPSRPWWASWFFCKCTSRHSRGWPRAELSPKVNTLKGHSGTRRKTPDFGSRRYCNHPERAARTTHDFQRGGDHYGSGCWKLIQIAEAGQTKFTAAVHKVVVWEWRIEGERLA